MAVFDNLTELEARQHALRSTMEGFCQHFVNGSPPDELLSDVFTSSNPRILEHGPKWAVAKLPFLSTTFAGRGDSRGTCDNYFRMLAATLEFFPDEHTIPPPATFIIDSVNNIGVVKARCKLASVETKETWEESFVFVFSDFDAQTKIGKLEIWSDALSAWNAVTAASLSN